MKFDKNCLHSFSVIKNKLTTIPVIMPPNWELPFEIMCIVSDYVVGVVFGQRYTQKFHAIYYAGKVKSKSG